MCNIKTIYNIRVEDKIKCMICDKIIEEGLFEFLDGAVVFYCSDNCRNYENI